MRIAGLFLAFLLLTGTSAWAQQGATLPMQDGPLNISPGPPMPDRDGAYRLDSGVTAPVLVQPVAAAYPAGASEADHPHNSMLSMIIGADGAPSNIQVYYLSRSSYDDAAIEAVKQCKFQPGTLNGKPVPVLAFVRVSFFHMAPAMPQMLDHYPQSRPPILTSRNDPFRFQRGDTRPKLVHSVPPEFSTQARRQKIQGVVLVTLLVNQKGEPKDLQVERSLGYGLDEKALQAVSQYEFEPAMRDGRPIAQKIAVEVNFRLY